jgi:hypothetical protein
MPEPGAEATDAKIFTGAAPDRLRHVAFADFSYAKVDGLDAKALFPVQGFDAQIGASIDRTTAAYVRLASGESVSMGAAAAYDGFTAAFCEDRTKSLALKSPYQPVLRSILRRSPSAWIIVLNEVFYAREIDVTFETKLKAGAGGGVHSQAPTSLSAAANSGNNPGGTDAQSGSQAKGSPSVAIASPGGSITYVHGSAEGFGLRRAYLRPIAVGYRGFAVQIGFDQNGLVCLADQEIHAIQTPIPLVPAQQGLPKRR